MRSGVIENMPKKSEAKKNEELHEEAWDLIIIGGGCVGLAGAMYAGRLEMKT